MLFSIRNNKLSVAISSKGAELQSIINKDFGLEYMWEGDPKFWGKKSPVLFPVVGELRNNSYYYKGKTYQLSRHGFAREMEFMVTEQKENEITFTVDSNEETQKKYPFEFRFSLRYLLQNNELSVTFSVNNTGNKNLFFSVGAHPAFKVPLVSETTFEDYYLQFDGVENIKRWPLSPGGLIADDTIPVLENTDKLQLNKSLFYQDALVFKHIESKSVSILSDKTPHGLTVNFNGFPYLGLWSAKDANFVCIEP